MTSMKQVADERAAALRLARNGVQPVLRRIPVNVQADGWGGVRLMRADLRHAPSSAVAFLGALLVAGCNAPSQAAAPTSGHQRCSVGMVTDYAPGDVSASSPEDALAAWLAAKRSDLQASTRRSTAVTTPDRATTADLATLDALRSVDQVLAGTRLTIQMGVDEGTARLRGLDDNGRSVDITLQSITELAKGSPPWMVTSYSIDLSETWCTQLPSS